MAEHATLSASGMYRWQNCTGYLELQKEVKSGSGTSVYAREGSAAHDVAYEFLKCLGNADLEDFLGEKRQGIEITEEMLEAVQVYTNLARTLASTTSLLWLEERVSLNELWPEGRNPTNMFGTADLIAYDHDENTLHVVDYKHGQGVVVEVKDNAQLWYYGLGALFMLQRNNLRPNRVVLTVVQPRAPHKDGPIRSDDFTVTDLIMWGRDTVVPAVEFALSDAGKNHFQDGKWCQFCPAAPVCPLLHKKSLADAQKHFDQVDTKGLTPAELGEVLDNMDGIRQWLNGVEAECKARIESGMAIPGWRTAPGRAMRKWSDPAEAGDTLRDMGMPADMVWRQTEVRSPTQILTDVRKKDGKSAADDMENHLKDVGLLVRESKTVKLVPDTNRNQTPASEEFEELEL